MYLLDILVLSCFIGYFAIWHVTPVLHSPLMSVTNAVSGIVIVGAFQALRRHCPSRRTIYSVSRHLSCISQHFWRILRFRPYAEYV